MATATGISVRSVQRIWRRHGLQLHRMRQSKLSNDAQFAAKFKDIVGLYFDPPAHAIVLSLDEKSRRRGTGLVTTGRFLGEGMKSAAVSGTVFSRVGNSIMNSKRYMGDALGYRGFESFSLRQHHRNPLQNHPEHLRPRHRTPPARPARRCATRWE